MCWSNSFPLLPAHQGMLTQMCAGGAGKVGRARRDHSRTEQVSDLGCFAGACLQMRNPQHDAWLHPSSVRPDGSIWPRPAGERSPPAARLNVRSWCRRGRPAIADFTPREQRFLRDRLQGHCQLNVDRNGFQQFARIITPRPGRDLARRHHVTEESCLSRSRRGLS